MNRFWLFKNTNSKKVPQKQGKTQKKLRFVFSEFFLALEELNEHHSMDWSLKDGWHNKGKYGEDVTVLSSSFETITDKVSEPSTPSTKGAERDSAVNNAWHAFRNLCISKDITDKDQIMRYIQQTRHDKRFHTGLEQLKALRRAFESVMSEELSRGESLEAY